MSGLFIEIANMSISAGCVALIVMLVRLLIGKSPKKYSYMLWTVVFFRFVCPFTIQIPVSIVPVQQQTIPSNIIYSENPYIQSGLPVIDNVVNDILGNTLSTVSPENSVNPIQIVLEIGTYIWFAGFLVLFLYGVISYLRLKKKVSTAIRVHDNIYETDLINAPFVLGFIHPKIYTPIRFDEQKAALILKHEQTHIKRFDYLMKPLAFIIASVHWFNPLAWVSCALMAKDMELSADETVMNHSGVDIRGDYSNSLIAFSFSRRNNGLLSPLAFGETGVQERVVNVLCYKKPAFWISIFAILLVITSSILLLGNSVAAGNTYNNRQEINTGINETLPTTDSIIGTGNDMETLENGAANDNNTVEPTEKYQTEADFLNSVDGVAFQAVAYQASKALLCADMAELSIFMVDSTEAESATQGLTNIFDDLEYLVLIWNLDSIKSDEQINASYRYLLKGEDSVSYVSMELVKIDDVWKVRSIGIEK